MNKDTYIIGRSGEIIARTIDRKKFLKTGGAALFAMVAAIAGGFGSTALAASCNSHFTSITNCSPIQGRYCSGCSGADCPNGCQVNNQYWNGNGCWCTQSFQSPLGSCYQRYYICCDCTCSGVGCTCRQAVDVYSCR